MLRVCILGAKISDVKDLGVMTARYQKLRGDLDIITCTIALSNELMRTDADKTISDIFLIHISTYADVILSKKLYEQNPDSVFIFASESFDYTADAYSIGAINYLKAPITEKQLFIALDNATSIYAGRSEKYFAFSSHACVQRIPMSSIVYVEFVRRALYIHLINGKVLKGSTLRIPFKSAAGPLLHDMRFVMIHQSFVVNMAYVEKMSSEELTVPGDFPLPISRNKIKDVKTRLTEFVLLT